MENCVGVIGGMGPKATVDFYNLVTTKTKAEKDQDHVNLLILSDPKMPDRTAAILSKDPKQIENVYNRLYKNAKVLEDAGCKAICITCNTAHYFADLIKDKLKIPIIHMINETAKEVKNKYGEKAKIGILATDGTIKSELYQKALEKEGLLSYIPSNETQKLVMFEIYDRIKSGKKADMEKWNIIEKELVDNNCVGAILGCTELSVINREEKLNNMYIDPLEVLADRTLSFIENLKK